MESLVLNKDNVKLKVKASDWEEAVRIGAGMLVEQGCAKQSYVDGIIASVKELGPYIVIADGIAMPHTRPEQGAIGIGCSLITLDQPVKFDGDDSEVKVMICFSAVDSESHMDILKMIVEFVERGLIDDIAKATTYEELLAEKDSQIQRLSDQLASANITIEQLEIQLTAVEDIPVLVLGEEQDLYPFEQKSMLIEILERELRSTKANSRKAHILTALLNANKCDNTVDEKRKRIKACLHGYSKMTAAIRKELEDIGFSLSDDGKHVKAVFGEDQRYMGTLSKTGSDHRAGDNIAHDLIRLIF